MILRNIYHLHSVNPEVTMQKVMALPGFDQIENIGLVYCPNPDFQGEINIQHIQQFVEDVNFVKKSLTKNKPKLHCGVNVEITNRYTGEVNINWQKKLSGIAGIDFVIHTLHGCAGQENIADEPLDEEKISFITNALRTICKAGGVRYLSLPDLFIEGNGVGDEMTAKVTKEIIAIAKEYNLIMEMNLESIFRLRIFPCASFGQLVGNANIPVHIDLGGYAIPALNEQTLARAQKMVQEVNLQVVDSIY